MNYEMQNTLAERIRLCAKLAGTRDALSQKAGIPRRTLETYLSGEADPKTTRLIALARAVGVSVEWLATGEGPMRRGEGVPVTEYAPSKSMEPLVSGTGEMSGLKLQEDFVFVPRYDVEGSMGHGAVVHSEQIVDHLAFKADWVRLELGANPKNLILISAVGDSMEPTLRPGDLLLVDRGVQHIHQDAIHAFSVNGDLRIKRIQRLFSGTLIIKSDNQSYRQEELPPDQSEELRIIGRIVWAGRRM